MKNFSDLADIYFLTEKEYGDPSVKNESIKKAARKYVGIFVNGMETPAEELTGKMASLQAEIGILYSGICEKSPALEQLYLLDADKIRGMVFAKNLTVKCGTFHPEFGMEGVWEYLCRLAHGAGANPIAVEFVQREDKESALSPEQAQEGAFVKAYALRSHINDLHRMGILDSVFQKLCGRMREQDCFEAFQEYMNVLMSEPEQYESLASRTAPFLVLKGDETCMGVLQRFSDDLAQALALEGQAVMVVDGEYNRFEELQGKIYKGMIGFQTKALEIDFFRKLTGPKFQFWMDYPLHFKEILRDLPQEYYVLCQDADYAALIRRFFHTPNAVWFPPGGIARGWEETSRPYDIVFIGSYFRDLGAMLSGEQRAFYDFMLEHPQDTFERGLRRMTGCSEEEAWQDAFAQKLYELKPACRAVIGHFREKVLDKILESGYDLHVYGDGWESYPKKKPNLIVHPQVSVDESLAELQKAKIGLNVMSWHKAGMTERIANIMLSGAVCLSEETVFLREHLRDKEEILLFGLQGMDELPELIAGVLRDEKKRREMAGKAYEKAMREFTWEVRARQIIEIAENHWM